MKVLVYNKRAKVFLVKIVIVSLLFLLISAFFSFCGLLLFENEIEPSSLNLSQQITVVIDAGHGGTDFGAIFEERNEKEDTLALALLVYERLEEMGIDAELTRDTDKKISLEKRCSFANRKRAEFFVSLHRNSAEGAKGVEIWVTDDENSEKDVRLLLMRSGFHRTEELKKVTQGVKVITMSTATPKCRAALLSLALLTAKRITSFWMNTSMNMHQQLPVR